MRRLVAALMVLAAAPAYAMTTLSTPLIFFEAFVGQGPFCTVVNVSTKPIDVTLNLVDFTGNIVGTEVEHLLSQAGNSRFYGVDQNAELMRCTFTFSGSAKSVRAAIDVLDINNGVPLVALSAS